MCLRDTIIASIQMAGTAPVFTGAAIRGDVAVVGGARLAGTAGEPVEAKFTLAMDTVTWVEAAWRAAWADQMAGPKFAVVASSEIRR